MDEFDYFWVDFTGFRIKAGSRGEAYAKVLKQFEDGDYPDVHIEQEQRAPLRAWPVGH